MIVLKIFDTKRINSVPIVRSIYRTGNNFVISFELYVDSFSLGSERK